MRKIIFSITVAAFGLAAACSSQGSRSADPVTAEAVRAKIESRHYRVDVDRVTSRRGRTMSLTTPYNIRISEDSIYSYLPYFGQAYTPVLGTQEGLVFNGKVTGYTLSEGKRGSLVVKFSARTIEDRYDYFLTVYPNGNAYLTVTPDRKSGVNFDGKLRLDDR